MTEQERTTETSLEEKMETREEQATASPEFDGGMTAEEEAMLTSTVDEDAEEMDRLIEASFAKFEVGEIVRGVVLKVGEDYVVIDIGSKSEGIIPLREFLNDKKDPNVYIGMEVEVMVVQKENSEGLPVLSRNRAKEQMAKVHTRQAFKKGEPIDCVVTELLKGGFQVDVDGLRGFIPFSQMGPDSRTPEQQQALIGRKISAKIIEMRGKRDLILSQRSFLEERREKMREETMNKIQEGVWIKGRVKNLTDFGAFIDLGGLDGLLHVNDMSWGHVGHPKEIVKVGDELEVMILKIDGDRISLGLKQRTPDPWLTVDNHYPLGCIVHGQITSLVKYGVFIQLEEGVEGLVHISEISWTRRLRHPSEEVKVGDDVRVKVLGIDKDRRRISLSMRQATTDPWTLAKANYPIGSTIEGEVTGLTDFGAFIRLPEGVDGMIHVSDLSWTEKVTHPKQVVKKGDKIVAKVLDIDPDQQRISLGVKQMEPDPWDRAREKYQVGDNVEVDVVKVTDFGAFVRLEEGVEGLAHVSTLPKGKSGVELKEGDRVKMKVIKFDRYNRKISLSMKDVIREQERAETEAYMASPSSGFNSLGDLISQALSSQQQTAASAVTEPQEEQAVTEPQEEAPAAEVPQEDTASESESAESTETPVEETAAVEEASAPEAETEAPAEETPSEAPSEEAPSETSAEEETQTTA